MKLVTSIYEINEIEELKDYIEYALVAVPHLSVYYKDIDIDKAIQLLNKYNKKIILNINRIMHPSDIDMVINIYKKYLNTDIMFYIADLGAYNEAINLKIENRIIYNPETMITNYLDLNEYASLGANACGISSEITLKDLKLMNVKTNANIFYQVFGRRLMFYSRRKLITLYETKNTDNYPKTDAYLREATRKDFCPINENQECTVIYRPYNINLIDKLNEISFIKYAYVETLYLNFNEKKIISECFYKAINGNDLNELRKITDSLGLEYQEGFFIKDSVYQKEELKNV